MNSKAAWRKGPVNHIVCTPPHDRPIFCLDVGSDTFVTGSADHGLRQYNIQTGKHIRQLFGKKYGHKEWVSTCSITPTGQVLSGGMDSVVCIWDRKGVKCDHLLGHQGSISKVMGNERLGISASYDATMMIWDLASKQTAQKLVGPHKQAVMTFDWHQSLLVSGDKTGVLAIWDLNRCSMIRAVKCHKGSVSNLSFQEKNGLIISTGLNDGSIVGIDMRTNSGVHKSMVHKGAVNGLKIVNDIAITCSADQTIRTIKLPDFTSIKKIEARDMIFAIQQANGVILGASSGGNVIGADLNTGQVLYGYGVMKKGQCRLLGTNKQKSRLVCAGEDDSPSLLTYD